jgi:hypothetical protein
MEDEREQLNKRVDRVRKKVKYIYARYTCTVYECHDAQAGAHLIGTV